VRPLPRLGAPGSTVNPRRIAALVFVSQALSGCVLVMGGSVLLGWQLDMNPLTALALMLAAGALWLAGGGRRQQIARVVALLVVVIGLVTVAGYLAGQNTGVNFLLVGIALIFLDWEPRPNLRPAQVIILFPATFALTSVLEYVYETRVLHGVGRDILMALPTAVAFLLLSIGILCARPDRGLTAVVMSDDAGGVLARRLLPAAVLIPPFLGWLRLAGQQAGTELSLTLSIVLNILLFTVLIWVISRSLNRADITRRMGERRLATQYATVHILAQSGTLSEAMPQILEAVSTSLNWVVAIRWSVDAESNVLRCGDIWMAPSRVGQDLADKSRQMAFAPGVGLPGRIWSSGRAAWISDITEDSNFPRAEAAARDGLHGAFGFPIIGPGGFLGVMEFFSPEIREPDAHLLQMFDATGRQIGQFIARKVAEAQNAALFREIEDKSAQLEERVRMRTAELRALSSRLLVAQETEARRIARELHDDLNQGLALLSVEMELLGQNPPASADQLSGRMQELVARARQLSSSVHHLSHQLHPAKLEQLGLVAAVGGLCRELTQAHGLEIEFTPDGMPASVPPDTAVCLYRLVQEGLRNVVKHSGAHHATVDLRGSADAMSLRIVDDGAGFDAALIQGKEGLGLVSMRERVLHLGGTITIDSRPSSGTRIDVGLPLGAKDQAERI